MISKAASLNTSEKKELAGMVRSFYDECESVLRPKWENPISDGVAWQVCQQFQEKVAYIVADLEGSFCQFLCIPNELCELEDLAPEGVSFPWRSPKK